MKWVAILISLAASVSIVSPVQAQGFFNFNNLDFEQAQPVPIFRDYIVTASSALPSWTVTIGGVEQTQVYYNAASTGAPAVTLLGPRPPSPAFPVIDGNYSVLLQGASSAIASISQTGQIPSGTEDPAF
jgi:hypothetical protein